MMGDRTGLLEESKDDDQFLVKVKELSDGLKGLNFDADSTNPVSIPCKFCKKKQQMRKLEDMEAHLAHHCPEIKVTCRNCD